MTALEWLDPASRALLRLAAVRGMTDEEVGRRAGIEVTEVRRRRQEALKLLAVELVNGRPRPGAPAPSAEAPAAEPAPDTEVPGTEAAAAEQSTVVEPAPEAPTPRAETPTPEPSVVGAVDGADRARSEPLLPAPEAVDREPPRRRRRVTPVAWTIAGGLVAVAIVLAVVTAAVPSGGGGSGSRAGSGPRSGPGASPGTRDARPSRPLALRRLAATPASAHGNAVVVGARRRDVRVRLTLRGLPRTGAAYEVWLYDSEIDARPLARFHGTHATLRLTISRPRLRAYRAIDVSREPLDGNPNHSGASVLRLSTRLLRSAAG